MPAALAETVDLITREKLHIAAGGNPARPDPSRMVAGNAFPVARSYSLAEAAAAQTPDLGPCIGTVLRSKHQTVVRAAKAAEPPADIHDSRVGAASSR
ncbi:hypothetical protein ACFYO1_25780 [Nocardia sp. NPDC006044]|uniref:hypothetical protein n=1 Tax=Nocardia sp. NPDC006044 TaxID=3364306 RepID=UPI0036BA35D4